MSEEKSGVKEVFTLASLPIREIADDGKWMDVVHPETGSPVGLQLKVHGEDSRRVREARNRITAFNQMIAKKRGKKGASYDDALAAELILACGAVSDWRSETPEGTWEHLIYIDDETKLPCTDEAKKRVFDDARWITDQVVAEVNDRGNFTQS